MSITLTHPTIQIDTMISRIEARLAMTERFSEAWEHLNGLRDELQDEYDRNMGQQLEEQSGAVEGFRSRRSTIREWTLPKEAAGLKLCKLKGDDLVACEIVMFERGREGADTVLRRAEIHGKVGPVGATGEYWADILDSEHSMIETIALDRESWNGLKNKWMRCKLER